YSANIVFQRRPGVLRGDVHAVFDLTVCTAHIWFVVDLHNRSRIVQGPSQHASWAVVLHRTREHALTGGIQGRDDRVTLVPSVRFAIPGKRDALVPIYFLILLCP